MDGFSFAYMQEAFVATLLVLARGPEKNEVSVAVLHHSETSPNDYEFYTAIEEQVKVLREDMDTGASSSVGTSIFSTPHDITRDAITSPSPWCGMYGQEGNRKISNAVASGSGLPDEHLVSTHTLTGCGVHMLRRNLPVRE